MVVELANTRIANPCQNQKRNRKNACETREKSSRISPAAPRPSLSDFYLRSVVEPDNYAPVIIHRNTLHENAECGRIKLLSMLRQVLHLPDKAVCALAAVILVADLHLERRVPVKQFLIACAQRGHLLLVLCHDGFNVKTVLVNGEII